MDTIKLWVHNSNAVHQAIELGKLVHYAGGYFEIFEPLNLAYFVLLQLLASAQERLRHWLDEHLRPVVQRE
jgi:hypothetical protein